MAEHAYPYQLEPHPSHISTSATGQIVVPGFRYVVERGTNKVTVIVYNSQEEQRALAPAQ